MPYRQHRMIQKHPRSGKPHDHSNLLPHLRLVAMHFTVCTECFLFHKWTFLASESGIIRKFLTGRTHLSCRFVIFLMILPAVQPDHLFHDILFFLPLFFYFILFIHIKAVYSVSISPGFTVFTLKKKYRMWHTHTTARQILPTGTFFMQINPIAITTVTVPTILHFVPIVMALFWTKLSRCFLYKFVPMNQSCSFWELFAKQNRVAM